MRKALLALTTLAAFFPSCAGNGVKIDSAVAAVDGGDLTGLVDGCGRQVQDGLMVCRKTEGEASQDSVYFIGPPAQCAKPAQGTDACVFFKIFRPDGALALGDAIPRGQTRKAVPWSTLLGSSQFELSQRGMWFYTFDVNFTDDHGAERTSHAEGEIYLRVLRKDYQSLHDAKEDPNFVWQWVENGVPVKMTSSLRVFVGSAP